MCLYAQHIIRVQCEWVCVHYVNAWVNISAIFNIGIAIAVAFSCALYDRWLLFLNRKLAVSIYKFSKCTHAQIITYHHDSHKLAFCVYKLKTATMPTINMDQRHHHRRSNGIFFVQLWAWIIISLKLNWLCVLASLNLLFSSPSYVTSISEFFAFAVHHRHECWFGAQFGKFSYVSLVHQKWLNSNQNIEL